MCENNFAAVGSGTSWRRKSAWRRMEYYKVTTSKVTAEYLTKENRKCFLGETGGRVFAEPCSWYNE